MLAIVYTIPLGQVPRELHFYTLLHEQDSSFTHSARVTPQSLDALSNFYKSNQIRLSYIHSHGTMRPSTILSSLLIAASTTVSSFIIPKTFDASSHLLSPNHITSNFLITRRQNTRPPPSLTNATTNATAPKYEEAILSSCTSALTLLASKPESLSGMSICYNILQLNNISGVFKSDLRLFKTAEPREAWANISSRELVPSVEFIGSGASLAGEPKRANPAELFTGAPQLKESYVFVGKINPQLLNRTMNMYVLLIPLDPHRIKD